MIFQYTLPQILNETKTQTRRILQPGEIALRGRYNRIEAVISNNRVKWETGKTYAVQPGRGQSAIARIRLVSINSEGLMRIHTVDAIAEGFASRKAFLQTWQQIHGAKAFDMRVWVLKFELVSISVPYHTLFDVSRTPVIQQAVYDY